MIKTQNDPEDYLLFSRIQSLHHCLEVDFHDEEDESVSSTLCKSESEYFPGSTSVQVLSPIGKVLVDELAESRGFALAFDRLAKSHAFNFNGLRTAFLRFPARCRLGPCCSSS